jgi:hypothetical protein
LYFFPEKKDSRTENIYNCLITVSLTANKKRADKKRADKKGANKKRADKKGAKKRANE